MCDEIKYSLNFFQESMFEENAENAFKFSNPDIVQVEYSFIKGFENKAQNCDFENLNSTSTHQNTDNEKNNSKVSEKDQQENQEDVYLPVSLNQINEQVDNLALNALGINGDDFARDYQQHEPQYQLMLNQDYDFCNKNIFEKDQIMILNPPYDSENPMDQEDLDHDEDQDQKFLGKKKQRTETNHLNYDHEQVIIAQETSTFTTENKPDKTKKERFKKNKTGFLLITPELNMKRMDAVVKYLKCRAFNHFSDIMKKNFKNTKNQKKLDKDFKTVLSIFRELCTLNIKKEDNIELFYGKTNKEIIFYFQSEKFQVAEEMRRKAAFEKRLRKEQNLNGEKIKSKEVDRKEELLDEFKKINLKDFFDKLPTDCQTLINRKFESFFEELKENHIKEVADHIKMLKKENQNQKLIDYYSKFYKLLSNQKEEYYDIKKISENDKQKLISLDLI